MQKLRLFPKVIGIFLNSKHNIFEKNIVNKCFDIEKKHKKGGDNWLSNVYNTDGTLNLYKQKEFKQLLKWIDDRVVDYCKDLKIDGKLKDKKAWFNIYKKGDSQEYHIHKSSSLSAIYYLKGSNKSAKTVFVDFNTIDFRCFEYNEDNSTLWKIPFESGKLIIFKSDTLHCTEKHNETNERITLAINYTLQ